MIANTYEGIVGKIQFMRKKLVVDEMPPPEFDLDMQAVCSHFESFPEFQEWSTEQKIQAILYGMNELDWEWEPLFEITLIQVLHGRYSSEVEPRD